MWEHILSALYWNIIIGRFLQLMHLILKEGLTGIIKKYEIENHKVNRIFYIYAMSKNFKHICITELNLIKKTLGFGSANAYTPLTIRHRSVQTQWPAGHSFATVTAFPLLHAGKVSRSQQKGY